MHDDVTRPKGSLVVVVTLKSKMATSSVSCGGNRRSTQYLTYLKAQTNPLCRWKYDAILDSCVTTTTTMPIEPQKHCCTSLCIRPILMYLVTNSQNRGVFKINHKVKYSKYPQIRTLISGFSLIIFLFTGYLVRNEPRSVLKFFLKLFQKQYTLYITRGVINI